MCSGAEPLGWGRFSWWWYYNLGLLTPPTRSYNFNWDFQRTRYRYCVGAFQWALEPDGLTREPPLGDGRQLSRFCRTREQYTGPRVRKCTRLKEIREDPDRPMARTRVSQLRRKNLSWKDPGGGHGRTEKTHCRVARSVSTCSTNVYRTTTKRVPPRAPGQEVGHRKTGRRT